MSSVTSGVLSLDVLAAGECDALIEKLRVSIPEEAPVYGLGREPAVHSLVRRTTRLCPPPEILAAASLVCEDLRERLSLNFAVPLQSFEEPQFLRYTTGDYFVAHQDGNTPLIHDDSRHRRVSLIVFLSDPRDFSGGDLLFHLGRTETFPARRGTAVAFRSELTHEVTPVTGGERYTIVSWYR